MTRVPIHEFRRGADSAASFPGIDAGTSKKCAAAIQTRKTATPTAGPRQVKCQTRYASLRRKYTRTLKAAMNRSGYRNSKSLDMARDTVPAARIASSGIKNAAVGLSALTASTEGSALRFSQVLRRLRKTRPHATALNTIQPACE